MDLKSLNEDQIKEYFLEQAGQPSTLRGGEYATAFAIMALKAELAGHLSDIYEILGGIADQVKVLADDV
jgi:hypothetical protein